MSRRSTPERLHHARRAATVARLIGEREARDAAEHLVASWEAQAERDGLEHDGRYWQVGWTWIADERVTRRMPWAFASETATGSNGLIPPRVRIGRLCQIQDFGRRRRP